MSRDALQKLLDENEIKNLITRLSYAIDERNIPKCRAVFADHVDCDFDRLGGAHVKATLDADLLASQMIKRIGEFQVTQHLNTMHLVEVSGDEATLTAYVIGSHYLGAASSSARPVHDPWSTLGARYEMKARRFPGGWLFTNWVWRLMWSRDNHGVWDEVGRRVKAKSQ